MCSHNQDEKQTLQTQHHPYKHPQADTAACLPAITQIVNLSLTNGEFCDDWSVAVVKPLLKNLVSI